MRYEDVHEVPFEPKCVEAAKALRNVSGYGVYDVDPDAPRFDFERVNRLLKGAIDTHIHSGPDPYIARHLDEIDLGMQACEMGMGAVVFKSITCPTARSAYVAQKAVDQWATEHGKESTKLIGGIVLDYAVGGLNPEAVRCTARIGGKFVWTPVSSSSHQHKIMGQPGGIEVIGKDDRVVPELREIFQIVARYDMVLGLCHHSTRERFIMIDDAKEEGVKRIVIVHPTESVVKMSIDQMKIAAEKGAYLELNCIDFRESEVFWDEWIEIIKEVGPDHIVLGTDCGHPMLPPPAAQYRVFLFKLLQSGIPEADVEKMARINAERLIF